MNDLYWWTGDGDAGQIGTTAQIGLPKGERILTVRSGLVVSARTSLSGRYTPADLIVRDIRSGAVVRQIATSVGFPHAELVGRQLFWTGMEPSTNVAAGRFVDGGVWVASIDDNLTPTIIVRSGRNVGFMGMAEREPLKRSPSGLTLASSLTGSTSAFTDIIDTSTLAVRTRLDGAAVFALTDDTYVVGEGPPGDSPDGRAIHGFDFATGAALWTFPDPAGVNRFALANIVPLDAGFVVDYMWQKKRDQYRVASLDARTGEPKSLLVQRSGAFRYAVLSISSAAHIALVPDFASIAYLVQEGTGAVSILDTTSGVVTANAFVIDPPWLCYATHCLRD